MDFIERLRPIEQEAIRLTIDGKSDVQAYRCMTIQNQQITKKYQGPRKRHPGRYFRPKADHRAGVSYFWAMLYMDDGGLELPAPSSGGKCSIH